MAKANHLSYKVTKEGAEKIERLREKFIELDDLIDEVTLTVSGDNCNTASGNRAAALSKTYLEDARMRAVEAVCRLNNNGPVENQGTVNGAVVDEDPEE